VKSLSSGLYFDWWLNVQCPWTDKPYNAPWHQHSQLLSTCLFMFSAHLSHSHTFSAFCQHKFAVGFTCPHNFCLLRLALQPPWSGTYYPLAFGVLPLPTLSVASLKLTAPSRPTAPHSGSAKCLRFSHWLTLCTLNMLTYYPYNQVNWSLPSFWEI